MKKNKILYITAIVIMSFASCKDDLNLTPTNGIPNDVVFKNTGDFELAARGMYGALRDGTGYFGGTQLILPDVLADNVIINQNGRKSQQSFFQWIYSSAATSSLFTNAYVPIRRANTILMNLDKLPDGAVKNNFRGEALAVRAMAHFDVLRLYAKRFSAASENTDAGVPYVTSTDISLLPARNTMKESFNMIIADLIAAEAQINISNGVGRLGKAAVSGLLARVYLYKNDFANAAAAADRSLAAQPGISDNPATVAQLPSLFKDATEAGVLFKIRILDEDGQKIGVLYSQTITGEIKSEYVPFYDLFTQYAANDVRKATYFQTSAYLGTTYNHIALYLQRPNSTANVFDFKVLRVAEVLLTQAEAYAQNSAVKNEAKALAALNALRANRYTGFVAGAETGQELLDAIAKERRLELAFQGDRFYDLKRKNVDIVRDAVHGEYADGTGTIIRVTIKTLPANDKRWFLPFPQTELNVNKNLLQDPEWR